MIQELHAGDRQIPASSWNEMRAAIQGLTPAQQQYQSGKFNPAYITIKNATGYDLDAFSVVTISGATYSLRSGDTFVDLATKNGVELNGDTPAAATDTIAITQAACAAGEFVKAMVSGATACYINKPSGVTCNYARPTASHSNYLEGTDKPTGIRVLWTAGGTGVKEAYVRLGTNSPQYITTVQVYGTTGGGHDVFADIDNVTYTVLFPSGSTGLSARNYPDIYPYDEILVLVDIEANACYAVDYPTDYEGDAIMAYYNSPWGRGWVAISTPADLAAAGFTLYRKDKTDAIL